MQKVKSRGDELRFTSMELGGTRYAVVPEATLMALCRRAGVEARRASDGGGQESLEEGLPESLEGLSRRLAERRKRAGLTQSDLAQRAGVRVETVNRIERGRVMPDFGTIRKLVEAMVGAERELAKP
jgi:DNA-binding XRE family transcriptional regulator